MDCLRKAKNHIPRLGRGSVWKRDMHIVNALCRGEKWLRDQDGQDYMDGSESESAQFCLTFATWTVHGILQARTLEWVAFPFSRGSSQTRDRTQVSCHGGRFFTCWTTREAHVDGRILLLPFLCKFIYFNWRIIALQNFIVFCQTSTWISHRCTYIPSLLNLPSISGWENSVRI